MLTDVQALVSATLLTFVMVMSASLMKSKAWTPSGLALAFGNRDNLPEPSPVASRADRAAKNMLEGMVFFVALACAARFANRPQEAALGATVFVYARVVYWFVYLAGVPYLRTAVWFASVAGLVMMGRAALG
ncbi:MAG: MAPEG family protein [Myxococcales bacterium]|nr:MAPEG family protein [Myxococcales bacterium]